MTTTTTFPRRTVLRIGGAALALPALMRSAWAQETFTVKIAHSEAIGSPFTPLKMGGLPQEIS